MPTTTRILLADDDADDRELFSEALESLNANVLYQAVEDGKKAMETVEGENTTRPDIIFLDINMPVMSGWEVLTKIKSNSQHANIPVIVYSTSSGEKEKRIAFDLGAACFVTKPDNIKKIRAMLEIVLTNLKKNDITPHMCQEIQQILWQA